MQIKPPCQKCRKPFLLGKNGLCQACLVPGTRRIRLRCYCGKIAVQVILVEVLNPDGISRTIQLALCRSCLELERELEQPPVAERLDSRPNPVKVIIVQRVPRPDTPPKGRKIA